MHLYEVVLFFKTGSSAFLAAIVMQTDPTPTLSQAIAPGDIELPTISGSERGVLQCPRYL
jgi:hypothetical protein